MDDLIRDLRSGAADYADSEDDADAVDLIAETPEPAPIQSPAPPHVPDCIVKALASDSREELMAVANMLTSSKDKTTLTFHTPIGDINCLIDWCSHKPRELYKEEQMFIIRARKSEVSFSPKLGSSFEVSFGGHENRLQVMCVAPAMQMYPGVDVLCFLPDTSAMEKQGAIELGRTPSAVSGKPSDAVDDITGEPIVALEKSANVSVPAADAEDFDVQRT